MTTLGPAKQPAVVEVISPLCSEVKVPVCLNSVDRIGGYFNWMWTQNVVPGAATPAFPFSTTMHPLPPVPEGQKRGQQTGNWCKTGTKRLPKSDHKLVAKGGKRAAGKIGVEPSWWLDRCVSASRFLPPGVLSLLASRHAPSNHLAIAHNPLPSNNHLSQIHLRLRWIPLNYPSSPPPRSLPSPTTDHFLFPPDLFTG